MVGLFVLIPVVSYALFSPPRQNKSSRTVKEEDDHQYQEAFVPQSLSYSSDFSEISDSDQDEFEALDSSPPGQINEWMIPFWGSPVSCKAIATDVVQISLFFFGLVFFGGGEREREREKENSLNQYSTNVNGLQGESLMNQSFGSLGAIRHLDDEDIDEIEDIEDIENFDPQVFFSISALDLQMNFKKAAHIVFSKETNEL